MRLLLITLILFHTVLGDPTADEPCSSPTAQQSCGQCIKDNPDCAWCLDPHSTLKNRCQIKSKFTNLTCTPHLVYSPQSAQVKIQQNLPLETKHHDGKTTVRLQPQATSVRLMPSHSAVVPFKYLHQTDPNKKSGDWEMMEIQTSDFSGTPLQLKFFVMCEGERKETKSCRVQNNQIVEFEIEIRVDSCSSTGDITISVGVFGQRTIAGLYVTTVCGCECEKHPEMNSRLCHQSGHLVCGQCVCNPNHGGEKCECSLDGLQNGSSLEDGCKLNSSSPVCSGSGTCKCGQCECFKQTITGKYCECNNDSCPSSVAGKVCSGNGVCECGSCKCENGWDRDDCSCSTESDNCIENGELCSNSGKCECNRCVCNIGKTGAFCGSEEALTPSNNVEENKQDVSDPIDSSIPTESVERKPEDSDNLEKLAFKSNLLSFLTIFIYLFMFMLN